MAVCEALLPEQNLKNVRSLTHLSHTTYDVFSYNEDYIQEALLPEQNLNIVRSRTHLSHFLSR
jgi:hypothetical protein